MEFWPKKKHYSSVNYNKKWLKAKMKRLVDFFLNYNNKLSKGSFC